MYEEQIVSALRDATSLVVKFFRGDISLKEFVEKYGSFYYYEALDGHEANSEEKQVLDELRDIVEFHERIQTGVVDAVYFESNGGDVSPERVTPDQAKARFCSLCYEYDAESILTKLSE